MRRNYTETQQKGHIPRLGLKVENVRSVIKYGAPKRIGCTTVEKDEKDPAERIHRRSKKYSHFILTYIGHRDIGKRIKGGCDHGSGKSQFLW